MGWKLDILSRGRLEWKVNFGLDILLCIFCGKPKSSVAFIFYATSIAHLTFLFVSTTSVTGEDPFLHLLRCFRVVYSCSFCSMCNFWLLNLLANRSFRGWHHYVHTFDYILKNRIKAISSFTHLEFKGGAMALSLHLNAAIATVFINNEKEKWSKKRRFQSWFCWL